MTLAGLAVAMAAIGRLYRRYLRRWVLTWGATADEVAQRLPGDELLEPADIVVTQRELLQAVWGPAFESLRLYMTQIRRKLEPVPARPRYFLTEPGMGYRFQKEAADGSEPP